MNSPLFNRAMLLKLLAVFTLLGATVAVLPIPRFETENKSVGFEAPLQKEAGMKFAVMEQRLQLDN